MHYTVDMLQDKAHRILGETSLAEELESVGKTLY